MFIFKIVTTIIIWLGLSLLGVMIGDVLLQDQAWFTSIWDFLAGHLQRIPFLEGIGNTASDAWRGAIFTTVFAWLVGWVQGKATAETT